jgi:DNA polymerase-1
MNIPKRNELAKRIRKLLIADEGKMLVAIDASQSELRWIAHISGDPVMIKTFIEGKDIHIETARDMVSKKEWETATEEIRKKLRNKAKPVNFGIIYKISPRGLVTYAKNDYGVALTENEAKKYIDAYFRKYGKIKQYHYNTVAFCRKFGYVETCFGRRRRLPSILSKDSFEAGMAERQAVNHPVQGPSSDMVLLGANDLLTDVIKCGNDIKLILFIHDELIFEVDENSVKKYVPVIKKYLISPPSLQKFGIKLKVPFVVDVKVGKNLAEMQEYREG